MCRRIEEEVRPTVGLQTPKSFRRVLKRARPSTDRGPTFLYGDSDTLPQFVAFYDTLGIRRTHSRHYTPGPSRGHIIWPFSNASHGRPDFLPCWNDRSARFPSYFVYFEFVLSPNLLYVYFFFAKLLATPWPFLQVRSYFIYIHVYKVRYFFSVRFFYVKYSMVTQVRRISTALLVNISSALRTRHIYYWNIVNTGVKRWRN